MEIHNNSLESKIKDYQNKTKLLEDKIMMYEKEIDGSALKLRQLEIELQVYQKKSEANKPDYKETR